MLCVFFKTYSQIWRFSSSGLIVSSLIFRALIHFEWIFVYSVKKEHSTACGYQVAQHHLLKKGIIFFWKINWLKIYGFVSELSIMFQAPGFLVLNRLFWYWSIGVVHSNGCQVWSSINGCSGPGIFGEYWLYPMVAIWEYRIKFVISFGFSKEARNCISFLWHNVLTYI